MPPKLRGIEPGLLERPPSVRKKKRSWSVILIVLYLILKAEGLFSIVAIASGNSAADLLPRFYPKQLIGLVTQQDIIDQDVLVTSMPWFLLLIAACYTITGLGLLLRTIWARKTALFISGVEMIGLGYVLLMPAYAMRTSIPAPHQMFLIAVFLLDALAIYLLVRNARVFEGRN
jgi:hypothetical protein